jgi:hypothetical protein
MGITLYKEGPELLPCIRHDWPPGIISSPKVSRCTQFPESRLFVFSPFPGFDCIVTALKSRTVAHKTVLSHFRCRFKQEKPRIAFANQQLGSPLAKTKRLNICCLSKSSKIIDSRRLPLFYLHRKWWSRDVARWFRFGLSVSGSFVCRCLTIQTMPRFHIPLVELDRRI